MDWALCSLNAQASEIAENRHKYRSECDARVDNYTEESESEPRYQPGELCNQTCAVESGTEVYYVGQGSKYRSGRVNLPSFVSRDGVQTLDWAIISSDGQKLPYTHVEGDSGAWVIKRDGNMLMGQVHSYTSGQVLFTPIDIIFKDIEQDCGAEVSLPPRPLDPGPTTTEAYALCARPTTPPIRPFKFLKPRGTVSAVTAPNWKLDPAPIKTPNSFPASSTIAGRSDTFNEGNEIFSTTSDDSPSSLRSPRYTSQARIRFHVPISLSIRKPSWRPVKEGKVTKIQIRLRRFRSKSSRFQQLATPGCCVLANAERAARRIEDVDHLETLEDFSGIQRVQKPLKFLEFEINDKLIDRPVLPVLESCSMVA
ncbi:MAG: hypothetical protein Q9191_008327 [Dirinaria sp. TL-2023a]